MNSQDYIAARKDHKLAVLEGFHAIKHAFRFGADVIEISTDNKASLIALSNKYAPDVADKFLVASEVSEEEFTKLSHNKIYSGVVAVAKRKTYLPEVINQTKRSIIWLDNPRNHKNVGAVIRLAAGLEAGAMVITGDMDIWNPEALVGSAGLHYAVPVIKLNQEMPKDFNKPVFAFDDKGKDIKQLTIPKDSILVFGSERRGVQEEIKNAAEDVVALPMKSGVSSYNLATSVALAFGFLRV